MAWYLQCDRPEARRGDELAVAGPPAGAFLDFDPVFPDWPGCDEAPAADCHRAAVSEAGDSDRPVRLIVRVP